MRQERAEAIRAFAERLRTLREEAGNPSFRRMSGRSRAISHTTLHEAAQGHRLPSWTTTVEFVKACGGNPETFRTPWKEANQLVHPLESATIGVAVTAADSVGSSSGPLPSRLPLPGGRYLAVGLVVAGTAAATLVGTSMVPNTVDDPAGSDEQVAFSPPYTSADCPIRQSNPPPAAPRHEGDHAKFIADVTLPDCTRAGQRKKLTKVWRFKNTGTVPWRGYALRRIDLPQLRDQCQTIVDIPVPDTAPGEVVDIKTEVTTPAATVFCFVRFKMVDATGRVAYPGDRPLNFQLIVE